jgi:hypothetical protein
VDLDGVELWAIVKADGAASAALANILSRNETLAVHSVGGSKDLLRTGCDAASTSFAFILDDDRSRNLFGGAHDVPLEKRKTILIVTQ